MVNKPNTLSEILKSNTPAQRIMLLTLLGLFPSEQASAAQPPYCKDVPGYSSPQKPPFLHGNEVRGKVKCIVDGDTFDVQLETGDNVRVRLWGIDCPESSSNRKCMRNGRSECQQEVRRGKRASKKVRKILSRRNVTLQPPYKNNGNRLLSYVNLKGGIDLGRMLIDNCICLNNKKYRHKRKRSYSQASRKCR